MKTNPIENNANLKRERDKKAVATEFATSSQTTAESLRKYSECGHTVIKTYTTNAFSVECGVAVIFFFCFLFFLGAIYFKVKLTAFS